MSDSEQLGELDVYFLGRVEYEDGLALQERFLEARRAGVAKDTLFLLEHPPVLTLGRGAKRENVLAPSDALASLGVQLYETNRGGDVTYHGPGQIVGYPIFFLPKPRQDVRRYVRDVEACVQEALAGYGIHAAGIPKWPGVWIGHEGDADVRKVAAIGVHLSRWHTSHGFALNVNTQLAHFELIIPCGIREGGVTSMERELGHRVDVPEVERALAQAFGRRFGARVRVREERTRTVSVAVMRAGGQGTAEVLLLKRTQARGGFWQVVTGKMEPGESPLEAARREVREETGFATEPVDLGYRHAFAFGSELPPSIFEENGFAVQWPAERSVELGPEHEAFKWVPMEQALTELPFAGLRETVRRARGLPPRSGAVTS